MDSRISSFDGQIKDAQGTVPGIAVADGAVRLNVTNAKAGLYYGYRFAETCRPLHDGRPPREMV